MAILYYFSYETPQLKPSLFYSYSTSMEGASSVIGELGLTGYMTHSSALEGQKLLSFAFINKRKRKDKRNTGNGKTSGKYCQVERKKLKSPAFCDSLITTVHMFLGVTTALFMFLSPQLKLYWIYEFSLYHDKKNISITTRETPWTRFFPN